MSETRVRELALGFADAVEAAAQHAARPKGGQQVPFFGDFANCPPSTIVRLRWWAREFLDATGGKP